MGNINTICLLLGLILSSVAIAAPPPLPGPISENQSPQPTIPSTNQDNTSKASAPALPKETNTKVLPNTSLTPSPQEHATSVPNSTPPLPTVKTPTVPAQTNAPTSPTESSVPVIPSIPVLPEKPQSTIKHEALPQSAASKPNKEAEAPITNNISPATPATTTDPSNKPKDVTTTPHSASIVNPNPNSVVPIIKPGNTPDTPAILDTQKDTTTPTTPLPKLDQTKNATPKTKSSDKERIKRRAIPDIQRVNPFPKRIKKPKPLAKKIVTPHPEAIDPYKETFINNETLLLFLGEDDVICGRITEAARYENMGYYEYLRLYELDRKYIENYDTKTRIDDFIADRKEIDNDTLPHLSKRFLVTHVIEDIERGNINNLRILDDNYKILGLTDEDGNTLLHLAVLKNDPALAKWLIKRGLNPNMANDDSITPIEIAEYKQYWHVFKVLGDNGGK